MAFQSILFSDQAQMAAEKERRTPSCFGDLNLDQIESALIAGKDLYNLAPFFRQALQDPDAISYRQSIMKDLEAPELFGAVKRMSSDMQMVRDHLARREKAYYQLQKEWWLLEAISLYCAGVTTFEEKMRQVGFTSDGFQGLHEYLASYARSEGFTSLMEQTKQLKVNLAGVRYTILIRGLRVDVRGPLDTGDYSLEVLRTFERFQQATVEGHGFDFKDSAEMNHVEAQILQGVARLNQELFADITRHCEAHLDFMDATVVRFDREIQFYITYLDYIAPLKEAGLPFCYPELSTSSKAVSLSQSFDLALAQKLSSDHKKPVPNDLKLDGPERIVVVSGPNQGGKTTFARTIGQVHYLASLGLSVPGRSATLYLVDQILTHFEREEHLANLRGKLEDDIFRMHEILQVATAKSLVIMNEIFTSTSLRDAVFLSKRVMASISDRDLLCVWVTFLDELASFNEKTVSMTSTVVPQNPAERTFKVVRRTADGLAYAMSIAEKYGLTYDKIKERIEHESLSSVS